MIPKDADTEAEADTKRHSDRNHRGSNTDLMSCWR